jgi:Uncharacterized protein conserved in bacteria
MPSFFLFSESADRSCPCQLRSDRMGAESCGRKGHEVKILYQILIPMAVGAFVGGLTNVLAIKMLFHPFSAIYIGKWHLPFTPGLIPKRRDEIADRLGRMVIEHLLTADALKKKFQDPELIRQLTQFVQNKLMRKISSSEAISDFFVSNRYAVSDKQKIKSETDEALTALIHEFVRRYRNEPISVLLSPAAFKQLENRLPEAAGIVLNDMKHYLQSDRGQQLAGQAITDFIRQQSFIGELVLKVSGKNTISKHFVPGVADLLTSPVLQQGLVDWMRDELKRLWETPLSQFPLSAKSAAGNAESLLDEDVIAGFSSQLAGMKWAELPVNLQKKLLDEIIPAMVAHGADYLSGHSDELLGALNLERLISDQVRTFSLSELEAMIFSISKKELKMIANLGYLLGGLIGLIQGIVMLLI